MKLLIDEMWSYAVGRSLRESGFDVESVVEREDLRAASDRDLLILCRSQGRIIVTENTSDYRKLIDAEWSRGRSHAGFVYTSPTSLYRGDPRSVGRLVVGLEKLLIEDPDMTNRELWLLPPS